ncbi:MAG: LamG domain-containing protein, partial [Cyanobacteria bacterium P01_D01_bin.2]
WHQITLDFAENGGARLYVNGSLSLIIGNAPALSAIQFGGEGAEVFKGRIDDLALFSSSLSASAIERLVRAAYPVVELPLNDVNVLDGTTLEDNSRFGNGAVYRGTTQIRPTDGKVGSGALTLDGNSFVDVQPSSQLDLSGGEFTQAMWVYPQSSGPLISSVMTSADQQSAYPFIEIENSKLIVGFGDGSDLYLQPTDSVITQNQWQFVAVTFDGTTLNIYVDGEMVESSVGLAGLKPAATSHFAIGRGATFGSLSSFEGLIDDVAIYRYPLSQSAIKGLMHKAWHPAQLSERGAGVASADWTLDVPDSLEGSYQLQIQAIDVNGNRSVEHDTFLLWEGYVGDVDELIPPIEIFLPTISR